MHKKLLINRLVIIRDARFCSHIMRIIKKLIIINITLVNNSQLPSLQFLFRNCAKYLIRQIILSASYVYKFIHF